MKHRLYFALPLLLTLATVVASAAQGAEDTQATAHDPHYGVKSLWPADVEKTGYFEETWPGASALVRAQIDAAEADMEPRDPANWLLNGTPPLHAPNENVDVYFPAGSVVKMREKVSLLRMHLLTRYSLSMTGCDIVSGATAAEEVLPS